MGTFSQPSSSRMGESDAGMAGSSSAASRLKLLDLPAETLAHITHYVPRKSLFSLLTVSHQFHQLASSALYRTLAFHLAETNGPARHRDPSFRLANALHTILTSTYDYAQHVKFFGLRMVENDPDLKQKRIAAKFLPTEEAGMLLNTALLVMIQRAKSLEQFCWQVPIECSRLVYQALARVSSLQILHLHFDVQSVSKYSPSFYPPPPPPPGPNFGGQTAVWWDPLSSSSLPSSSIPSTGSYSKHVKTNRAKSTARTRMLGAIKSLQSLTITAIDDLTCLEEIASCIQASSGSLKTLTLSFAESLVSKSQKPNPNNINNNIHMQDDDTATEPNSPALTAAAASAPTELDLKREKQAQEQALARIFGLDKASASIQKHDKKVDKQLKHAAKGRKSSKTDTKTLDNLAFQILSTVQISKLEPNIKSKVQDLIDAIMPFPISNNLPQPTKKPPVVITHTKVPSSWVVDGQLPSIGQASYVPPANGLSWSGITDPANPSSSKQLPPYIGHQDDFTFASGSSAANPSNNPLPSWNSSSSQHGLPSSAPKFNFPPYPGSTAGSQYGVPKTNLPPMFGLTPTYAYHPNTSTSMVNSVSHPVLPLNNHNTQSTPQFTTITQAVPLSPWWHLKKAKFDFLCSNMSHPAYESHILPNVFMSCSPEKFEAAKSWLSKFTPNQANKPQMQSQNIIPVKKKKKDAAPKVITISDASSESSSESDSDSDASTDPNPGKSDENLDALDGALSDFDMDHPDVPESEEAEDSDGQDAQTEVPTPKPIKSDVETGVQDEAKDQHQIEPVVTDKSKVDPSPNSQIVQEDGRNLGSQTMEDSIQEYIRAAHGLSIHDLTLCFIPLKSSVIAKALDLTLLRRIVFFNVGSQGPFWTMIEKLMDQGNVFTFQSLYTDDVSAAFVSCLGKLPGLKSLHMLRRSNKEFSCTSSKPAASLTEIHRTGLARHFETLQSLSITNLEDDSWDLDDKLVRVLSNKAKKLRELAFSTDSNSFHTFLRCLPGFKSLVALHVINIKTPSAPNPMMPLNEWKKLILDVLCYYPTLKLRYVGIALVNHGRVAQIGEKPKLSISSWYRKQEESHQHAGGAEGASQVGSPVNNAKGKGKAPNKDQPTSQSSPPQPQTNAALGLNGVAMGDMNDSTDDEPPSVHYAKQIRTSALADSYAIYSSLVLKGRL